MRFTARCRGVCCTPTPKQAFISWLSVLALFAAGTVIEAACALIFRDRLLWRLYYLCPIYLLLFSLLYWLFRHLPASYRADERRRALAPSIDDLISRLRAAAANGTGDDLLDTTPETGVIVEIVTPPSNTAAATDSFPRGWQRDGVERGHAEWCYLPDCDTSKRLLFVHGSGYLWYSPKEYRPFCTRLAKLTGMAVLAIDYRKAPEHVFPAAIEDALDAFRFIANHGPKGDTRRASVLVCAGDSSGGGQVLATLLAARDGAVLRAGGHPTAPLPAPPSACAFFSPWVDLTASGDSYVSKQWSEETRTGDPLYSSGDIEADRNYSRVSGAKYAGEHGVGHPLISPLRAKSLAGLPPMWIGVGDAEVMSSEAHELFERVRAENGTDSRLRTFDKMWHTFILYAEWGRPGDSKATRAPLPQAIEAAEAAAIYLRRHGVPTAASAKQKEE